MADGKYGPHLPDKTFMPHAYSEQLFDTGEVMLNYAMAGSDQQLALIFNAYVGPLIVRMKYAQLGSNTRKFRLPLRSA
jgi:hypothetical protein